MTRPFRKKLNPKLLEKNRCYSVADLSELYETTQRSILNWISHSLQTIDSQKPYLIFGNEMIQWIKQFRPTKKKKSDPNKVYCLKCRDKVGFDFQKAWVKKGNKQTRFLQSRCPKCQSIVNKVGAKLTSIIKEVEKGLIDSISTPLKQPLTKEVHDASIQRKERAGQIPLF
jgi:hypothetical protein